MARFCGCLFTLKGNHSIIRNSLFVGNAAGAAWAARHRACVLRRSCPPVRGRGVGRCRMLPLGAGQGSGRGGGRLPRMAVRPLSGDIARHVAARQAVRAVHCGRSMPGGRLGRVPPSAGADARVPPPVAPVGAAEARMAEFQRSVFVLGCRRSFPQRTTTRFLMRRPHVIYSSTS